MQRRTFIKSSFVYGPALWAALQACHSETPEPLPPDKRQKFIIVGAGIAGLHAASLLLRVGHEVEILEAGVRWGGRIRSVEGFADFPVEGGAEEVHGQRSAWYDIVSRAGGKLVDVDTTDFVQFNTQLLSINLASQQIDMQKALQFIERALVYSWPTDKTVGQYATEAQTPATVMHYVNALLGNEHGTSMDRIGIRGLAEEEKLWSAGDRNYAVTNLSLREVVQRTYAEVLGKVTLQTPVVAIDYSGEQVRVTDSNKKQYTADKVLITVPLTVMKAGDIQFTPALPAETTQAYGLLGMDAGMKIFLKFKDAFWPPNTGSVYSSGLVPEYWISANGRKDTYILTAFATGSYAERLSVQGKAAIIALVDELAALYKESPVKSLFVDGLIVDWRRDPYIRGAYSYPLVGGGVAARKLIAAPLASKLYFAGRPPTLRAIAVRCTGPSKRRCARWRKCWPDASRRFLLKSTLGSIKKTVTD